MGPINYAHSLFFSFKVEITKIINTKSLKLLARPEGLARPDSLPFAKLALLTNLKLKPPAFGVFSFGNGSFS